MCWRLGLCQEALAQLQLSLYALTYLGLCVDALVQLGLVHRATAHWMVMQPAGCAVLFFTINTTLISSMRWQVCRRV